MEAPFRTDVIRILLYSQFSSLLVSIFFLFKPTLFSKIRSSQRKWMDGSSTWRWRDNERRYLVSYSFKGRGGGAYPSVRWFIWICLLMMDQRASLTPNTAQTLWLYTPQQQRGCFLTSLCSLSSMQGFEGAEFPFSTAEGPLCREPTALDVSPSCLLSADPHPHAQGPHSQTHRCCFSPVCGSSEMNKPFRCRKKQPARECLHVAGGSAVCGVFMRVGGWFSFYCFWMVKDKQSRSWSMGAFGQVGDQISGTRSAGTSIKLRSVFWSFHGIYCWKS